MRAIVSVYSDLEDVLLYHSVRPRRCVVSVYNVWGREVFRFSFNARGVSKLWLPLPHDSYFLVKIEDGVSHDYAVLRPRNEKERLLFVLRPKGKYVTVEGDGYVARKRLQYVFDDLAWCDITDLSPGKYVVRQEGWTEGFAVEPLPAETLEGLAR